MHVQRPCVLDVEPGNGLKNLRSDARMQEFYTWKPVDLSLEVASGTRVSDGGVNVAFQQRHFSLHQTDCLTVMSEFRPDVY